MAGGIIVLGLFAVIILGPQLSPHSPYTTRGLTIEDGVFSVPPFAPDDVYPWGTDMLGRDISSLVLSGAQQTLFLNFWRSSSTLFLSGPIMNCSCARRLMT